MKTAILILAVIAVAQAGLLSKRKTNYMKWIEVDEFNRIVGGSPADLHEFKHQISLQFKSGKSWYHICGGSIIDNIWVITAAHCVDGTSKRKLRVDIGQHQINDASDSIINVNNVYVHSGYDTRTLANDIALLRLSSSITVNSNAAAVKINYADPATFYPGKVIISGWGATSEGGSGSSILRKVTLDLVSDADCTSYYGSEFMKDAMFCAAVDGGDKDSCQGDSGGPALYSEDLIGLVSWGYGCARPGVPGVYTRLHNYEDWIGKTMA